MDATDASLQGPIERVAVIGAGLAGLTCAASLMLNVPQVRVFDAAPRPGGRTAAHRESGYEFDAGAQFFTARSEAFRSAVEGWVDDGLVVPWMPWVVELSGGDFVSREEMERFVGVPHMGALAVHLAELCDARVACAIGGIERGSDGLRLVGDLGEDLGVYDFVIVAAPPTDIERLVREVSEPITRRVSELGMTQCWALMLGYRDRLSLPFDAAYITDSPLSWAARNNSKPGRGGREAWVAHASPEWSEANATLSTADAALSMTEAFSEAVGGLSERPQVRCARLWTHAAPIEVLEEAFLVDAEAGIAVCGDWCVAPRVEGAFLSGVALADYIVARL